MLDQAPRDSYVEIQEQLEQALASARRTHPEDHPLVEAARKNLEVLRRRRAERSG